MLLLPPYLYTKNWIMCSTSNSWNQDVQIWYLPNLCRDENWKLVTSWRLFLELIDCMVFSRCYLHFMEIDLLLALFKIKWKEENWVLSFGERSPSLRAVMWSFAPLTTSTLSKSENWIFLFFIFYSCIVDELRGCNEFCWFFFLLGWLESCGNFSF